MKLEVPEFKRCCCCLPLRYGLLFWGYVKLIASVILLGSMMFVMVMTANKIQRMTSKDYPSQMQYMSDFTGDIIIIVLVTLLTLLEISMNTVFVVGGHKKNPKLMKVFYYYNIVVFCLFLFAFSVSTTIEFMFQYPYILRSAEAFGMAAFHIKLKLGAGILNAVIQLYLILLIRSEIKKLKNHGKFRFKNNAIDAECNMEQENENIKPRSDENSEKLTEVTVNEDNVIKNNNLNRENDEVK